MEIDVKNLGALKEGKIDLSKNLIIFAGQNNTGKSYMAYLSYGLYRNATEINENIANQTILKIFASKTITPIIKITAKPEPFFRPNSVHFFPAERTAINMHAKEVFREKASRLDEISQQLLVEEDSEAIAKFIRNNRYLVPRYPLAIRDYLAFINDLGYIARNESEFADFAEEIETTLLQGKVSVSEYGDLKFTPQNSQQTIMIITFCVENSNVLNFNIFYKWIIISLRSLLRFTFNPFRVEAFLTCPSPGSTWGYSYSTLSGLRLF